MEQRVLVCGGRDYSNRELLFDVLDTAHAANPIVLLIHGAYRGADTLADEWAKSRGVEPAPFPADWDALGPAAGPTRNQRMIDEGKPHLVIAFPGASGTADCIRKAEAAGIPVARVKR